MAINYTNPARGNTHELINRPIINNSGASQYATFLDLIKFGTLTDFIDSGTTIDNWPDFFNTISTVLTNLDSSLRALEAAIDNPSMCIIHWDENKGYIHIIQNNTLPVGQTLSSIEIPYPSDGDLYGLFKGWYTDKTSGVSVDENTIVPNTRETTFYAHWDTNKYTIHFENTGNSIIDNQTPIYKDHSYYVLPNAANYSDSTYNYTFKGWSLANNGSVQWGTYARFILTDDYIEYAVGNVLTLYGVWESALIQNTKTITFVDLLGNEHPTVFGVDDSIDFTKYTYDSKAYNINWYGATSLIDTHLTVPATIQIIYPFDGWYTDETGGTKMTSDNTTYEQLVDGTIYYARASSTPIGYTANDRPSDWYIEQRDPTYIQFPANNPTKERTTSQYYYEFDGWYTTPDGVAGGYKVPTTGTSRPTLISIINNITYYAHFSQLLAEFKSIYFYDADGGRHRLDIYEGESLNFDTVASENNWNTTKEYTVTWQHSPSNYGTYVNLTSGTFTRKVKYTQSFNNPWSIAGTLGEVIPKHTTISYNDLEDGATYNMVFDSPTDPDNNSTTLVMPTTQSSPTGMTFDYWQIVGGTQVSADYRLSSINSDITIRAEYKNNVTYYWYAGQTDPTNMSSISPIVTDTESAGWRLIGTTIGSYTMNSPLWNGAEHSIKTGETKQTTYIALPNDTLKLRDGDGNEITAWINHGTKVIDGVTYTIYQSPNNMKIFNNIIY